MDNDWGHEHHNQTVYIVTHSDPFPRQVRSMSPFGVIAMVILFLFGNACAEMPNGGKATSLDPRKGIPRDSDGCKKGEKGKQPPFIQGEVLVQFKPGLARNEIDGIREAYGLSLIERIKGIGGYCLKFPRSSTVKDMVEVLSDNAQIEYAEPNYTVNIPAHEVKKKVRGKRPIFVKNW